MSSQPSQLAAVIKFLWDSGGQGADGPGMQCMCHGHPAATACHCCFISPCLCELLPGRSRSRWSHWPPWSARTPRCPGASWRHGKRWPKRTSRPPCKDGRCTASTCRAVPSPARERRVKGVPFPSAATPTTGSPAWASIWLLTQQSFGAWGQGSRRGPSIFSFGAKSWT